MKNISGVLLCALCSLFFAGCAGTPPPPATPDYEVFCSQGVQLDQAHPGYDPALGGYWLIGSGNTIRFEREAATPPTADLVLNIQTKPSEMLNSNINQLRIVTPGDRIFTTRFGDDSLSLSQVGDSANLQVLRNTGFVKIVRDNNRMRVTFSAAFLRQYAPYGMAVTWFDIPSQ